MALNRRNNPISLAQGGSNSQMLVGVIKGVMKSKGDATMSDNLASVKAQQQKKEKEVDDFVENNESIIIESSIACKNLIETFTQAQNKVNNIKAELQQCQKKVENKRSNLSAKSLDVLKYRAIVDLLKQIAAVKNLDDSFDLLVTTRKYDEAAHELMNVERIIQVLQGDNFEFASQEDSLTRFVKQAERSLKQRKREFYHMLLNLLSRQIYLDSTAQLFIRHSTRRKLRPTKSNDYTKPPRNETFDFSLQNIPALNELQFPLKECNLTEPLLCVASILHCLSTLQELKQCTLDLQGSLKVQLGNVIARASQCILDSIDDPSSDNLNDLLQLVFSQFKCILGMHNLLLTLLNRLCASITADQYDKTHYNIEEVWSEMLRQLRKLLEMYTKQSDGKSADSFKFDITSYFKERKPPKRFLPAGQLFSFKRGLMEMTVAEDYRNRRLEGLAEGKINEMYSEEFSAICHPELANIKKIYNPLMSFLREVQQSSSDMNVLLDLSRPVENELMALADEFLMEYSDKIGYKVVRSNADECNYMATKLLPSFPVPVLVSFINFGAIVDEILDLCALLPEVRQQAINILINKLQIFHSELSSNIGVFINDGKPNEMRVTSARWSWDEDLARCFTSNALWHSLTDASISSDEIHKVIEDESKKFMDNLRTDSDVCVITDITCIRILAFVRNSFNWLISKLRKMLLSANSFNRSGGAFRNGDGLPEEVVEEFNEVMVKMQILSDQTLLFLHFESHIRCFVHLRNIAEDSFVSELSGALNKFAESLSLEPAEQRYVFEGLGHMVSRVLVQNARNIRSHPSKINQKIYALQQNLANISAARQYDLDYARVYFELYHLEPEDVIQRIEQDGVVYGEKDYLEIIEKFYETKRRETDDKDKGDKFKERVKNLISSSYQPVGRLQQGQM